ncbi:hypothetical protein EYF80_022565 [Liparis tanakae]|uniref:Uncharacterized protein n=1 Tax=Liparis tanakae TaxID=230148 RepID=A0A4Z2HN87_9TELE|nr:hypothetical protein EYF80_022565 [Liparis tanakae]
MSSFFINVTPASPRGSITFNYIPEQPTSLKHINASAKELLLRHSENLQREAKFVTGNCGHADALCKQVCPSACQQDVGRLKHTCIKHRIIFQSPHSCLNGVQCTSSSLQH